MKRLQRYYYLVGVPLLLLALGTVVFFDEIASTVRGNPHPQINYVIFALIAIGGLHMLQHVHRINREARLLQAFMDKVKAHGADVATRQWLQRAGPHSYDVAEVLELVLDTYGKPVGAVQHAALESELAHFKAQLQRRLLLAQFLSGLMVGMGLLGTFIGLLGALSEIGKLIGSFAIGSEMSDPVAAVSALVTRLTEPMKAMGVAFSASLFGVLGSLVMGMLGVFIKSATGELGSLVQSRVVWLTDLGAAGANGLGDVQPLQDALSELARHSPLLQGLSLALDQSERRVRQLLQGLDGLQAQWQGLVHLQQQVHQRQEAQQQELREQSLALSGMHEVQRQSLAAIERSEQAQAELLALVSQQQQHLQQALHRSEPMQQVAEQLLKAQQQLTHTQMARWQEALHAVTEQMREERGQWLEHLRVRSQQDGDAGRQLMALLERLERVQSQGLAQGQQLLSHLGQEQAGALHAQQSLAEQLAHTVSQLRQDSQQRSELAAHARRWMDEQQARQEQLAQVLAAPRQDPAPRDLNPA